MTLPSLNGSTLQMDEPSIPEPRMTGKGIALAGCFWALYTILYALLIAQSEGIPFVWALSGQTIATAFLALYSVPVWLLTVRAMDNWHGGWIAGAHLVIGPLYAWGSLESYTALLTLLAGADVAQSVEARYGWVLVSNGTLYAIQFAIYHLMRSTQRLRLKEQQATALMALAQERELEALKAQVNPHFLFNTLNSISATVKVDPDGAREMIAELAHLLRYALDSAQNDRVALREEVAFARAYLTLEAHRFSDRLGVTYDVDADALDTPVPPMVLQPLVENAIKHGIAPSESGGTVALHVRRADGRIDVRVSDTGAGLPPTADPLKASTEGLGLANTNARLTQTYGPAAALHTRAAPDEGFEVWFSIPRTPPHETSHPSPKN